MRWAPPSRARPTSDPSKSTGPATSSTFRPLAHFLALSCSLSGARWSGHLFLLPPVQQGPYSGPKIRTKRAQFWAQISCKSNGEAHDLFDCLAGQPFWAHWSCVCVLPRGMKEN